jgi:hypothetical protein
MSPSSELIALIMVLWLSATSRVVLLVVAYEFFTSGGMHSSEVLVTLQNYMFPQSRGLQSTFSPPWEPQVSSHKQVSGSATENVTDKFLSQATDHLEGLDLSCLTQSCLVSQIRWLTPWKDDMHGCTRNAALLRDSKVRYRVHKTLAVDRFLNEFSSHLHNLFVRSTF